MSSLRVRTDEQGFTLAEVAVAMGVLAIIATGISSAVTASMVAATRSRESSIATALAMERLEQLRSLTWGFGDRAAPSSVSDTSTDLSVSPSGTGGSGLSATSWSSLASNVPGAMDYLDRNGRWVGNGAITPPSAIFVRRWRVAPLPGSAEALVLEVTVSRLLADRAANATRSDDVRLMTMKTRKAQ